MRTNNPARRLRAGRMAAVACASALALSGCDFDVYSLPLPGGADLGEDPYSVKVEFRDVLDLVPQSSVKVNDVTVGKVTDVALDGYHAQVTLALNDEVELPDNAVAEIRQTSLLGEKFVSLAPPETAASPNLLGDGDVITLDRSGRNPEVEEVLGAMSLLLNGGGVAQLKTISAELNKAFDGRESDIRSVLDQLDTFMSQLDENKEDIVQAIESLNSLAVSINEQRGSIELALDEMPAALASIDRQRDDLVKMLGALNELSAVGTDVIRQSKAATIDSLQSLDPVLTKLAEAGDSLPKAFQVFLTYPFVDEVVGRNPAQARNLHMGDYTNLSVQMDIDLTKGLPELPGLPLPPEVPDPVGTVNDITKCVNSGDPDSKACQDLGPKQAQKLCEQFPQNPVCDALVPGTGDGEEGGDGGSDSPLPIPLPGLGRALPGSVFFGAPTVAPYDGVESAEELGYEPTLGALLIQGMVQR
jgi:phospholipid/cholesterol/gamma-HCH transport system substrate-binding protein